MGLPIMDLLNIVATQFPDAVPILQQPGVFQVYVDYINSQQPGGNPWTTAQLQAALRATPYYQNNPQAVRDNDILHATDPATWSQKVEATKRIIEDLERQLGVTLDDTGGLASPASRFLVDTVKNGWDINEIKYRMLQGVDQTNDGGLIASSAAQVRSMANDYGVPLSDASVLDWGKKLAQGAMDMQGIQGYLIEQAKSLFPALSSALDAGITVEQYAEPYLQLAQQELEINPADINLTDAKWMAALNQVDPKTGQRTSMALDTWLAKLRTDPAYGYDTTSKGRLDATQLATQLQQRFGAAA